MSWPSCIWRQDSNPRPSEHESPPITTRPGLPPLYSFFKWTNSDLVLSILVLFKHKFYRKTVGFSGIPTRIVRVEGENAYHLTTTTALFTARPLSL